MSIATSFALLLSVTTVTAQTVEFARNLNPGDSFEFKGKQLIEMETEVYMGKMLAQKIKQTISNVRAGKVEILESDGGQPTSVRVSYDPSSISFMENDASGRQEQPFPFAGKTVTLTKKPDGSLDLKGAETDNADAIGEVRAILEPDEGMYPKGPVSVGDTWEAGKEAVAKSFNLGPQDQGSGTFKLLGVHDVNGRPTAEVEAELTVDKTDQTGHLQLTSKGKILIDLTTGEMVENQLNGPLTHEMTQNIEQEGRQVELRMVSKGKSTIQGEVQIGGGGGELRPAPRPRNNDGGDNPLTRKKKQPAAGLPFSAVFEGDELKLDLKQDGADVTGSLFIGGAEYAVAAVAKGNYLGGSFSTDGDKFQFSAELSDDTLKFESDGTTYELQRKSAGPKKSKNPLKRD